MNFALLWLDALLVSLLWVTALAACVGRIKRRWIRAALSPLVVGVPLFPLGTFVFAATVTKFVAKIDANWFGYALSLLLAYLVGASLILRRASRREPGLLPAAATWKRAPLAFAWLLSTAVGYMTLVNMDLAIRARCSIFSVKIGSEYLAAAPAIVSDSQNAARIYEKAFAQINEASEKDVQNPPLGNRDDFDPNEAATITFLDQHAATIVLLHQAAALPGCRFDQDLTDPDIVQMLPDLNEVRNAADVLNLHAREEITRGHTASAIADAAAIFGMSRHFTGRPLLVSALVGIGIDALGNKTLEQALPAVKSQDELSALHLAELPPLGRMFQQALRGEEIWGLALYDSAPGELVQTNAAQGAGRMSLAAGSSGALLRVFFLDLDDYLKLMKISQDAAVQPYYKVREELPAIDGDHRGLGLFTSILAPSLSRAFQTCARIEATDASAQAAVAMTRFRLDHGTLPSHLDDLVPAYLDAIPIDPFDGHPIRLAVKSDRCILYSVGPDRVDDGGGEIAKGKGDVIFTLKSARTEATTKP